MIYHLIGELPWGQSFLQAKMPGGVEQEVGMWEKIGTRIVRLRADRTATAALEYGIIAAILGLNLINLFMWWGSTQGPLFQHVGGGI